MKITYFGTGAALNKSVDTMHMKIYDDTHVLYIDSGGGMSLMQRIQQGKEKVGHIFMTHCHSDHILGIAHVIRVSKEGPLHIYCTSDLESRIQMLMDITGKGKFYQTQKSNGHIIIHDIIGGSKFTLGNRTIQPVNLFSPKDEQHGFMLTDKDNKLVFFGDEAINVLEREDLSSFQGADRLLCEAFCTSLDEQVRKPYEKQHITAKDAGTIATKLGAKNLIISHIDDYTHNRQVQLREIKDDASTSFTGNIIVPHDNDTIDLW